MIGGVDRKLIHNCQPESDRWQKVIIGNYYSIHYTRMLSQWVADLEDRIRLRQSSLPS